MIQNDENLKVKKHRDRDDLTGEHVFGDMGQLILFLIFLCVWIVDSFILRYSTFLSGYVALYVRLPLSLTILLGSVLIARAGLRKVFDEITERPAVIQDGVFTRVRHPIYLSALLFYLALCLLTLSIFSIIVWLVIFVFYHLIARFEEKLLLDRFGAGYQTYMNRVPMWIPRL
jgi:protein-S-isoprenylcysteine O-methyltransferase Ste14